LSAFVPHQQQLGRSILPRMAPSPPSGARGLAGSSSEGASADSVNKKPPRPRAGGRGGGNRKKAPQFQGPLPSAGLDGIIAVHKPTNWTSFDVVAKVRSTLNRHVRDLNPDCTPKQCRVKVGHGGTLDPAATGVLVIGIGKGTKAMDLYTKGSKEYRAVGTFGFETDTGDAEGVQAGDSMEYGHVTKEKLEEALKKFVGDIQQVPPQYSAIKKDGKKAYELARQGVDVVMEPRAVTIHSLLLTRAHSDTDATFEIEVSCGGGTYIRSLVRDIGRELDTKAHMSALVRTVQGEFTLDDCVDMEETYDASNILNAIEKCAERLDTKLG